ncbi:hypothetical protein FACS1894132_14000 [Clostridia bacterium]|nr:hypothetical protein FACS1894132_14000 [Clostridia bacterium]
MRKLKVYLDTSVLSYLCQGDAIEKMQQTQELWEIFKLNNTKGLAQIRVGIF